jgi:hypothetical protein
LEVTKRHTRITGALLLVFTSLMLASLACYSGQIPGVFELTPYHTPTPLPLAENSRFKVLETVLAPQEPGKTFFHLTVNPEPLQSSLMNSKSACQGDTSARILYVGQNEKAEVYYLIDCSGSVGWVAESRLAGPLQFTTGDRALVLVAEGEKAVQMLDDQLKPMPPNPLQTCKPETVITVAQIQAADPDQTGTKNVYYQINCPTTAGPVKGWVVAAELFGPIEINVKDRALAITAPGAGATTPYQLASEPAPLTEANTVTGECFEGSILEATEVVLANQTVYYKMTCGDIEGWTDQSRFVGPLLYDAGTAAVIYIPPILVFEDELPADQGGAVVETTEAVPTPEADTTTDGTTEATDQQRKVVEYVPPLYLSNQPGPAVPTGDNANVVGQCTTNTTARIEEYAAAEVIYDRIQCDECVQTEVDADGQTICTATETRDGWIEQSYLQGPLDYMTGEQVAIKSGSKTIETAEDGTKYFRLPVNLTGAQSIGQFTEFSGRCPLDQGVQIAGVTLEKARTSSKFSFYYQVTCMGQPAIVKQVMVNDRPRPEITYDTEKTEPITGILLGSDLQAISQ